jgi:hypothetical protein
MFPWLQVRCAGEVRGLLRLHNAVIALRMDEETTGSNAEAQRRGAPCPLRFCDSASKKKMQRELPLLRRHRLIASPSGSHTGRFCGFDNPGCHCASGTTLGLIFLTSAFTQSPCLGRDDRTGMHVSPHVFPATTGAATVDWMRPYFGGMGIPACRSTPRDAGRAGCPC